MVQLAKFINRVLSRLGLALVRSSTLAHLADAAAAPVSVRCAAAGQDESRELAEKHLDILNARIDELEKNVLRQQIAAKWEIVDFLERMLQLHPLALTCPLCNHQAPSDEFAVYETHCIFGGGRLLRHQCPECDLIFGADKMLALNPAELSQDYESHYRVYQEGDSTEQEIRAFHMLNPSRDGIYLNYGAGSWSKSVAQLRSQGWNVFAFEPHDSAATNHDSLIRSKADLLKMRFDGIFSNNVLEHLRYPVAELSFMKSVLKDGGRMSHATPCFEYLYEFTRFHLFFFLGRSRQVLADQAQLEIADFVVDNQFMCALYVDKNA